MNQIRIEESLFPVRTSVISSSNGSSLLTASTFRSTSARALSSNQNVEKGSSSHQMICIVVSAFRPSHGWSCRWREASLFRDSRRNEVESLTRICTVDQQRDALKLQTRPSPSYSGIISPSRRNVSEDMPWRTYHMLQGSSLTLPLVPTVIQP